MHGRRMGIGLCCVLVLLAGVPEGWTLRTQAQGLKTFGLEQAAGMALTNSRVYKKAQSKLVQQNIKYQQALKAITLKKKNKATFRWTPLLSFKLPEKADLADEAEYLYKPLQIQTETDAILHGMTDIRYQVREEVCTLYVDLYTGQEEIAYYEKRIEEAGTELKKNKARLAAGEAYQADVNSMEKRLEEAKTRLAAAIREFEGNKGKMKELTGLDVTSGYRFENPYVDSLPDRADLNRIMQHTLENDQQLYEAKLEEKACLMTLNANYNLMWNQYGSKMSRLNTYLEQIKRGEKPDTDSFKQQYDVMLQDVDSPWQGSFKILFIRFPKEWLKGQISGVRYVEDDPYLLFTNALDYQEAAETLRDTEKELRQNVRNGYENLVTARNSYQSMQKYSRTLEQDTLRAAKKNLIGEMPWEELAELQEELEEARMDELEALSEYSRLLYSYDRLTCGAVSLVQGADSGLRSTEGGVSYVTEEAVDGACYYIHTQIEDNVFELGIYLPEEYGVSLTDYELWCDGIQVGKRTPADKTIRHLFLDLKNVDRVFLRFYDREEFVDDCEIDPQEYSGPLEVVGSYRVETKPRKDWGGFTCRIDPEAGLMILKLTGKETGEIVYYQIQDENGNYLLTEELLEIDREFVYLALAQNDLELLRVRLYGEDRELLAVVAPDVESGSLKEVDSNE